MVVAKVYFWLLFGVSVVGIPFGVYAAFFADSCITPAQELRNLSWDGGFALITLAAFYGYVYRRPLLHPAIWKFGFVALTTLGVYRVCGGTLACRLGAIVGQPLDALTAEFALTAAMWAAYSAVLYVVLFLYAFCSRNLWIGGGKPRI